MIVLLLSLAFGAAGLLAGIVLGRRSVEHQHESLRSKISAADAIFDRLFDQSDLNSINVLTDSARTAIVQWRKSLTKKEK